jgi:hypothetical protein
MATTDVEPVDCLVETASQVICPEESIIDNLGLVGDMRDNFIKTSRVSVSRCNISLRCSFVPVPSPWGNEGRKVAIVLVQWNTVVSIPTIENGFLFATRNGAYLVERTLGVVGFSGCMKVECLEINCASGFAVFLGTHDHAMAPGHRLADGYRL